MSKEQIPHTSTWSSYESGLVPSCNVAVAAAAAAGLWGDRANSHYNVGYAVYSNKQNLAKLGAGKDHRLRADSYRIQI